MTKKRIALLLVLMLIMTSFLVACGGGSDDPAPAGDTGEETVETAEETEEPPAEETPEEDGVEDVTKFADENTLVVGGAELNGSYINGFGNSTYDVWIKRLIGNYGGDLGYSTIYYDEAGEFHTNPTVVEGEPVATDNPDGTRTYEFVIKDNLVWNDGTPITAKDYVFSRLYHATEQWMMTGANNSTSAEDLLGFDEFHDGSSEEFPGIELVDDVTFRVTLKADKVPYFYETDSVASSPSPLHRYAPDLDVEGSKFVAAEGYEISEDDKATVITIQKGRVDSAKEYYESELQSYIDEADTYTQFNEEGIKEYEALLEDYEASMAMEDLDPDYGYMLGLYADWQEQEAVLAGYEDGSIELSAVEVILIKSTDDVANNYRFNPDVTCGPYKFVEFGNNMAKVTINDKFLGNAEGDLPTIPNVIVQSVNSKIDVDLVLAGTVDIIPGVIDGAKIDKAKASPDQAGYNSFPRNGYGLLQILCHIGSTQHKGVRQAIAFSLDRNEFVQTIAGGYGSVVNGAFGVNQFEYLAKGEEFNEEATNYTKNADLGNAALDTTPYIYEADGTTPWDPAKAEEAYNANKEGFDYWRYDEDGKQLRVIHEGTDGLDVSELLSAQLPDNSKLIGMQYIFKPVDFATLIDHYYFPDENAEDPPTVFNMGTGFAVPNDPYYSYHSSQIGSGNLNRLVDPEIDKVLEEMRRVDSTEVDKWNDGWLQFQLWYNENLPNIPLYANEYYDIHTPRVQNLESTPMHDWSDLICTLELGE